MKVIPIGSPGPLSQTGADPAICLLHSRGMLDVLDAVIGIRMK